MSDLNVDSSIWENDNFPKKITPDEDIIMVTREDLAILGFKFIFLLTIFIFFLVVRIFISGYVTQLYLQAAYDTFLYSVGLILLVIFTMIFHNYYLSIQVVTNQRVLDIDQNGLFNREVDEVNLEKIEDVSYKQKTFLSVIFNYGNVILQSSSSSEPGNATTEDLMNGFVFNNVPDPKSVVSQLSILIKKNEQERLQQAAKYNSDAMVKAFAQAQVPQPQSAMNMTTPTE